MIKLLLRVFYTLVDFLFFYPGFFVHELSHVMMAQLLGVRVLKFRFERIEGIGAIGAQVILEDVPLSRFKRMMIGLAPVVSCTCIALLLIGLMLPISWVSVFVGFECVIFLLDAMPSSDDIDYIMGENNRLEA